MDHETRLVKLEARLEHERERVDYHLAGLARRLCQLEERPQGLGLSTGDWFKILIAICIPLLVLLFTGDPKAAMHIGRQLSAP